MIRRKHVEIGEFLCFYSYEAERLVIGEVVKRGWRKADLIVTWSGEPTLAQVDYWDLFPMRLHQYKVDLTELKNV